MLVSKEYDETLVVRHTLHTLFHSQKNHHHTHRDNQRTSAGMEIEESDSQYTYSNSNSPPLQMQDQDGLGTNKKLDDSNGENGDDSNKFSPKVQVIAASGDNIIAVANPALAMSRAIIPIAPITPIKIREKLRDEDKE